MSTWAPNTDRVARTPWGRSRLGAAVIGIWIHHQADGAGHDSIDYMIGANPRDSHPTYAIDDDLDATVVGIVPPDLAPSSTFFVNDQYAVTVEIANTQGPPNWEVTHAALEQVAQIIAHHANESPRAGHPIERNQPGVTQAGFFVGYHSQVYATACPGPFVVDHIDWIVDRANEIRAGKTTGGGGSQTAPKPGKPAPAPAPSHVKPEKAPAFPLPSDWYFGPESGPQESVSGEHANRFGTVDELRAMLWRWQQRMEDRGWSLPTYGSDGRYGDETARVVRAFQKEKGLVVDGLIGPATWAAAWTEPVT